MTPEEANHLVEKFEQHMSKRLVTARALVSVRDWFMDEKQREPEDLKELVDFLQVQIWKAEGIL